MQGGQGGGILGEVGKSGAKEGSKAEGGVGLSLLLARQGLFSLLGLHHPDH